LQTSPEEALQVVVFPPAATLLYAVVEREGWHVWQVLDGLMVPAATVVPLMVQPSAQVSVTCVHTPLVHEKEHEPVSPAAQVPELLPLLVVLTVQLPFSVAPVQAAGAQVSETWVHAPLVQVNEQLPAP
jgi:hypothetical protein